MMPWYYDLDIIVNLHDEEKSGDSLERIFIVLSVVLFVLAILVPL